MMRHPLAERGLHVAVLWSLAVAQPLFDLLEDNPEFFAARGASPGRIVACALAVTLVGPAAVLAVEWLAGLAGGPRARGPPPGAGGAGLGAARGGGRGAGGGDRAGGRKRRAGRGRRPARRTRLRPLAGGAD